MSDLKFEQFNNPSEALLLGLDIGGTKTAVVLGSVEGQIIQRIEIPTLIAESYQMAIDSIMKTADAFVAAQLPPEAQLSAVSVAIGGPLNIEEGIIFSPPHLPKWAHAPLKRTLEEHFALPVFIEHDGNAGALAELHFGAGKGLQNLIFLTMGTGLGAGIILNGQIYRGSNDLAGEIGHIRLAEHGPEEYGKAGSWEGFCSASGLIKLAKIRQPDRWAEDADPRQIIQQALDGDQEARALITEVGQWLGKGIATLIDILNPELVVVGTLGILLGDLLLEPARTIVRQEALPSAAQQCNILPAALRTDLSSYASLMAGIIAYRQGRWQPLFRTGENGSMFQLVEQSLSAGIAVRRQTIQSQGRKVAEIAMLIVTTLKNGGKVLVFGNGGSAAAAQHLAAELVGRYLSERIPLPAIALTADSSVTSCIGNDYGFEEVFARQVEAFASPKDIVIGITTSGNSRNVIRALQTAQGIGAMTIGLTGERGLASPVAEITLSIPSGATARIQEEHDGIIHAWCEVIDQHFSPVVP